MYGFEYPQKEIKEVINLCTRRATSHKIISADKVVVCVCVRKAFNQPKTGSNKIK